MYKIKENSYEKRKTNLLKAKEYLLNGLFDLEKKATIGLNLCNDMLRNVGTSYFSNKKIFQYYFINFIKIKKTGNIIQKKAYHFNSYIVFFKVLWSCFYRLCIIYETKGYHPRHACAPFKRNGT